MDMEAFWAQRWKALWFVTALGFVFSANYTNHGPLVPTLVKDLNITLALAGFLTTAIFLSHGALQIPGGALADKLGAKKVAFWALIIITVGNILIGFSNSYTAILVLKFIIGIGTGMAFIAGARYVPTFFAGKEIQRAQGVYGGSILLGSGFVIYGIPQILAAVGWHNVFMVTGAMAGLLAVLWFWFAPDTPSHTTSPKINWSNVLANPNIWLLSMAQMGSFGAIIAAGVWVNTLLIKSIHLAPKTAGMIGSTVLLLGIISRPLGGLILGKKADRHQSAPGVVLRGPGPGLHLDRPLDHPDYGLYSHYLYRRYGGLAVCRNFQQRPGQLSGHPRGGHGLCQHLGRRRGHDHAADYRPIG